MFVSQERGATRKPFQKPNILRRKPKATKRNIQKSIEFPTLPCNNNDFGLVSSPLGQPKELHISQPLQISEEPSFRVIDISEVCDDQGSPSQTINNGGSFTIYAHDAQISDNDSNNAQNTLNVESFLNHGSIKKTKMLFNIDNSSENVETETKQQLCLDFASDDSKGLITTSYYDGSQISNIYIDKSSIICNVEEPLLDTSLIEPNVALDIEEAVDNNVDSVNSAVKFMCDVPNCKKSFWTEAHLQNHKNVHNKPKTFPVLQCPVKKTDAKGVETQCERTFQIRNQLMKHLNEDHLPEDALYQCTKCGRRFYWACGARLHQAKGCARTYTCAWAGCGRVFRQQCRLREHARAHTGDRPYPCHYLGCGWSFRSASKLRRHARRHTGERRHACAACGRAFPRGEHLREHAARCREPAPDHRATHTGCELTSPDSSSPFSLIKKAHKDEDAPQATKRQKKKKDTFVVQLSTPTPQAEEIEIEHIIEETSVASVLEEAESCSVQDARGVDTGSESEAGSGEGQCARTHCTWPLPPREPRYDLDDHTQVEQSESCESNIFSVRSDLFLHGNLLINEDSEFIISRAAAGGEGAAEGALGLIDSHPTRDLTQEELMYADAVEESSFRVLLLNGEELA